MFVAPPLWLLIGADLVVRRRWLALTLVRCSDPVSGFFATDRHSLPDLERLQPVGYKIGRELMVRGRLRVAEVPIDFVDRDLRASKMDWRAAGQLRPAPVPPAPVPVRRWCGAALGSVANVLVANRYVYRSRREP